MNKFLDNIRLFQAGQIVKLEKPMFLTKNIEEDRFSNTVTSNRMYKYRIDVNIGHDVTCPMEELEHHKKKIQRSISELVYGDIERRLHEWFYGNNLRASLNQHEVEEFFSILEDMR